MHWSPPEQVSLVQLGYSVWHIDVQWIASRSEFWALYNVKTPGSCTTPAVYLATSGDGVTWRTPCSLPSRPRRWTRWRLGRRGVYPRSWTRH